MFCASVAFGHLDLMLIAFDVCRKANIGIDLSGVVVGVGPSLVFVNPFWSLWSVHMKRLKIIFLPISVFIINRVLRQCIRFEVITDDARA